MAGSDNRRALIAGAGIGGLASAVALRAGGWQVDVFERALDPAREAGTSFNLWGNAMTALDRLGLGRAARSVGDPLERIRLLSHRGEQIAETPIGEIGRRIGTSSVNLRRSDLSRLLLDACKDADIELHLGQACKGYRLDGDRVVLELADGTHASGDVLIGADGARSAIRAQLAGDGEPVASSLPVRGICEVDPGVAAGTVLMVWGPRGGGAGCWPLADGQVSWTVGTTSALRRRLDRESGVRQPLLDFVAGFPGPIEEVISATPPNRIVVSPVLVRKQIVWGEGRVALIGDAAHAMPTVYSQGACQALEDAVVLGEELAGSTDVVVALARFRQIRTPRMEWLRKRVFTLDKLQKFESRLMCAMRNTMARKAPPEKAALSWQQIMTFGHVPQE